ncbi:triose-phosphate isomerase [Devosia sp.]|uniref:triose-phosphate isomerase family protein n=1 Tax=Devosia sp. TaxID=1871048 RepID=UPI002732F679|nr:triose-phosphate isomerase [Devosia sp.]MDP2781842.1 triose-phosphate isomerase [Devosia sp.]
MTTTISPLIAGNWKMNGLRGSLDELASLAHMLISGENPRAIVVICPPATILSEVAQLGATAGIQAGGQDCHTQAQGAHTGDISASMLADAGAQYVIVGHSERRADHGETDDQVRAKAEAVVAAQLAASVPEAANFHDVIVAYEPIWAIGTGRTPTNEDIARMHGAIRQQLSARFPEQGPTMRILYGGSLKPQNAREILAVENVNGGLVGGASLLAKDFYTIISAV